MIDSREVKEKDLIRVGKCCKGITLEIYRRRFWQKVRREDKAPNMSTSIEANDEELLTGKEEVQ